MPFPNGWASVSTVIQSSASAAARRSSCHVRSGSFARVRWRVVIANQRASRSGSRSSRSATSRSSEVEAPLDARSKLRRMATWSGVRTPCVGPIPGATKPLARAVFGIGELREGALKALRERRRIGQLAGEHGSRARSRALVGRRSSRLGRQRRGACAPRARARCVERHRGHCLRRAYRRRSDASGSVRRRPYRALSRSRSSLDRHERALRRREHLAGRCVEHAPRGPTGAPMLLEDPALGPDRPTDRDRSAERDVQPGGHAPRSAPDHDQAMTSSRIVQTIPPWATASQPWNVGSSVSRSTIRSGLVCSCEVQAVLVQVAAREAVMRLELEGAPIAPRWHRRRSPAAAATSDVKVPNLAGLGLDEVAARLDLLAHELREDRVGLAGVVDLGAQQDAGSPGSSSFPRAGRHSSRRGP